MDDTFTILFEDRNEDEISILLKLTTSIHFTMTTEDGAKNIKIFKNSKKVDDFPIEPILFRVLDHICVIDYNINIFTFDEISYSEIIRMFIYFLEYIYNIKIEYKKTDVMTISIKGEVIYRSNILC